ncbi:outer membrane beta-barrel protein [Steroidobacter cummioxidans]|uniref:outer membrane beta-barrel protein n=1 Tax=Steroidobacter cummioxidans TaxID=1803913 RepID=UPI000E318263|nr:outer membrane beta-barrel protein [Steroidobacter cummioxidans]
MNQKRTFAAALAAVALGVTALSPVAQAAQPGFYIGGFYGQSDKDSNIQDYSVHAATRIFPSRLVQLTVESIDEKLEAEDSAFGFLGGYRFNTHFAVEGGYVDLGNVSYRAKIRGNITGIPTDATLNFDSETSGITVAGLGVWPLSYRWEVYGRAGALFSSNTFTTYYVDVEQMPKRERFRNNDVDFFAGIGTSYNFLEIYDLRLEYQRFIAAGDKNTDEADANMISIGISVVF